MSAKPEKLQQNVLWPSLPYSEWENTLDTVHRWMQIVGKVKLALAPFINQWWEVAFYVTPYGMTSGRIPYENEAFVVDFDFISHRLVIRMSNGEKRTLSLKPYSVAQFYKKFMSLLKSLHITVMIHPVPTEMTNPIPFKEDTQHASYDKNFVARWWRIQLQTCSLFDTFRTSFRGKSSPIQFFWGSFDLNGTRYSGKKATPPKIPGELGKIMQFAENEENFAFGFWPGDQRFPQPAFYAYIYPAPKGVETIKFGPDSGFFHTDLAECILPYESVRKASHPEDIIMHFLQTTYKESATLAGWDIASLEGEVPIKKSLFSPEDFN